MPRKQRRPFNIEQKAQAVVRHLQDNVPVSTLCDELDIHPNQFYDWQKQAMANLSAAFKKESNAEKKFICRNRTFQGAISSAPS